ncbi:MAG: hypothetical protein WBB19_17235 [Desulforhopalus sp.]
MSLTDNMTLALADSETLASFCQARYSKEQTVQLGVDLDNLPPESDFPIIMVGVVGGREGRAVDNQSAQFVITCGILDESDPVVSGRLKKYRQIADLEEFRLLVVAVIEAGDLAGGYVSDVEIENDPLELFPIFSTNMVVTILYPTPLRGRWEK